MLTLRPGGTYHGLLIVTDPATGALVAPDAAPTLTARVNGALDATITVTATAVETGVYDVAATLPQTLDSGDQVLILARYAVSAVALGQTVDRIVVGADAAEQEVAVQAACGGQEYDLASGVRRILARDGETTLRTLQVASEEDGQLVTEAVA